MPRIFGKDGPMLLSKNIGRSYAGTGKTYDPKKPGRKELERAAKRRMKQKAVDMYDGAFDHGDEPKL